MKSTFAWIALALAIAGGLWYLSVQRDLRELEQVEVQTSEPVVPLIEEPPVIQHPITDVPVAEPQPDAVETSEDEPEPLPPLEASDDEMLAVLTPLVGNEWLRDWLVNDYLVSRAVATVDSLSSVRVAPQMSPVQPVPGAFKVLGAGDKVTFSPENALRYEPLVDTLLDLDQDQLVALYVRYYPLFQEAFEAQGDPDLYFNDRLVEVIDLLLATPEPTGSVALKQNEAVYEFVDEQLEQLAVGQKMLIRLGHENQLRVKQWLRELRQAVAGDQQPESG